ncbi:PilZ domain-containing protein [Hahella aquimaris]|uniref:PilZ domain-containing protein n=1 Tax=Hahella sp. HNIBRBA332 TaxID=3015983 RepID=UPI00273BA483|nr:PilZ domain-containing protein [Hahella sp. HNIBRBA332]WLQ12031.1 PilZ domain-containing protein [Hahella sp. HNIBRBA332]
MSDAHEQDGRRSPRRNASWRTIVKTPDKKMYMGKIDNVSAHGYLFEFPIPLPVGATLIMKVEIVHHAKRWESIASVIVRHVVVRTSSYLVGVEITDIDDETAHFLNDYANGHV